MRACTLWSVLLLGGACVATVRAAAWWESAVVYQIYPRSFKDSNNDGIGDLNGITSKLQYLKDLGVDAIWLSPIYKSPMFDFGYDIADYKAIATEYGTMADFDNLMTEAKKLGIRVILDYVPNHTSHLSEWFNQSVARNGQYTDYYIWANGTVNTTTNEMMPPSNWVSIFRGSAWEYNSIRGQYYLHQFVIQQPDINYRSSYLREEMKDVLRFWLNKGVSGFRVDAVNMLYEVEPTNGVYPDEPLSTATGYGPDDYEYLDHPYTKDRNETYEVVYDWREVLDSYTDESKIMMTEAYTDLPLMMRYYGNGVRDGSIPFNFVFLGELSGTSTATDMKTTIAKWMDNMPAGKTANWVNGNHDQSRMASRHGVNRVDAMNMLALLLPGVTITYQGEELGMTDGYVSWADTKDPQACNTNDPINYYKKNRDPARTPFHWDDSSYAGFTAGSTTWLPVASNYATVNVKVELAANRSHLNFYKDVVALKHTSAISTGDLGTEVISNNVLIVTRSATNSTVVGIINLLGTTQELNLGSIAKVPDTMSVVASGVACSHEKGVKVLKSAKISVPGYCSMVLETAREQTTPGAAFKTVTSSFLICTLLCILYAAM